MKADLAQRIIFNILNQLEKPETLKIATGQIISVLIKEIHGKTAIISLQGKEFTAALEQEVSPGARLKCLVEGEKKGQLILRVLNGENEGISPQSLRSLLNDYGLKNSAVNLALIREMIKGEMPLVPSTLKVLSAFASQAGIAETDAGIPVFMVNRGIPLEIEAYRSIRELLHDLNFLQDSIHKFSDKLQLLTGGANAGKHEIVRLAQNLAARLKDFVIISNEDQQTIAFKLGQIFKTLSGGKLDKQNVSVGGAAQEESLTGLLDRFATVLTAAGQSEHGEMAQLTRSLAGKIELIQNFNKPDSGSNFIYLISSSIRFEDREEPFRIIINQRNGRDRQADFSSCRVEVTLNTPRLGLVKCEVQVTERTLTLQFYTDNSPSWQLIEKAKEDLAGRLKSLGFSVGILKTKTFAEKEEVWFEPTEPPLFRINLKV